MNPFIIYGAKGVSPAIVDNMDEAALYYRLEHPHSNYTIINSPEDVLQLISGLNKLRREAEKKERIANRQLETVMDKAANIIGRLARTCNLPVNKLDDLLAELHIAKNNPYLDEQ